MVNEPRETDSHSDGADQEQVGMPRWVKVFGIVAIVVIVVFVVLHLTGRGRGGHSP